MPKIRCLLVDDHTLFRQGVRRLLETESDFEVIGESPEAGDAVEKARELRPDIVLMDIGMPGLSSFEGTRQIKKNRPETKVLFLTMYEDEDYLVQCLEVGFAKDIWLPAGGVHDVRSFKGTHECTVILCRAQLAHRESTCLLTFFRSLRAARGTARAIHHFVWVY